MADHKPYSPPHVTRHRSEAELPEWARSAVELIRETHAPASSLLSDVDSHYIAVVDSARNYIQVSDNFCRLVDYERKELTSKRVDDLTAPNTNDIATVFDLFGRLGYMHGLWLLVSRRGTRILVRYEAWLRPDSFIEAHMEVVGAGY